MYKNHEERALLVNCKSTCLIFERAERKERIWLKHTELHTQKRFAKWTVIHSERFIC